MLMTIQVDASIGEGGGSVVRIASGLAVALGEKIRFTNIRKKRKKPGLAEQHLNGLRLLTDVSNSETKGLRLGSTEVEITPGDIQSGHHAVQIRTAGTVGLALQPTLVAMMNSPCKVSIEFNGGATYGKWAPSVEYVTNVPLASLAKIGVTAHVDIAKHGFYPQGGAKVSATLQGVASMPNMIASKLGSSTGTIRAVASNNLRGRNVAERILKTARETIASFENHCTADTRISYQEQYVESQNPGAGATAWFKGKDTVAGASTTGERRLTSEQLGKTLATACIDFLKNDVPVDTHQADQLIPASVFVKRFDIRTPSLSNHTRTNIQVLKIVAGVILETEEQKDGTVRIFKP